MNHTHLVIEIKPLPLLGSLTPNLYLKEVKLVFNVFRKLHWPLLNSVIFVIDVVIPQETIRFCKVICSRFFKNHANWHFYIHLLLNTLLYIILGLKSVLCCDSGFLWQISLGKSQKLGSFFFFFRLFIGGVGGRDRGRRGAEIKSWNLTNWPTRVPHVNPRNRIPLFLVTYSIHSKLKITNK